MYTLLAFIDLNSMNSSIYNEVNINDSSMHFIMILIELLIDAYINERYLLWNIPL